MSEDRIITGIKVTDGAQPDGLQLPELIEKSKKNGVDVKEVIGDMAYVSDDNLESCEKEDVTLYARTNSAVAAAANTELEEGFSYSKDAHMLQCPAGHLATRVDYRKASNGNTYANYCFSAKACKKCPLREQCKVGKSKTHTYNITQANEFHKARLEFESSELFKKKLAIRHRIEEKNGKMKMLPAYELSFLNEEAQRDIVDRIDETEIFPSHAQARCMRKAFEEGKLDYDSVTEIMAEVKPNQVENLKIPMDDIRKYVPKDFTPQQIFELAIRLFKQNYDRQHNRDAR